MGTQYDADDVRDLLAAGHELASHTASHVSARAISTPAYVAEIERGAEGTSGNFSYPYGEVTLAAKRAAGRLCTSCRGTQPGTNGPRVDLNLLRANALYSSSVDVRAMLELIDRECRPGSWLIFYTHDVQDNPSPYGCTPAYFERVVGRAVAGARVVPVAAALAAALL
jgi:peptidoglycan/xylan/chitin deacetylase (PgdA/CDA1 family)